MTCPCCGTDFPWEAGLAEADAKRLGAILGAMDAALARAAMSYLRFFKPQKTALRLPRAIKLLQELGALIDAGTVCRDERTGVDRPAPAAIWIAGIEQMLQQSDLLTLPLSSHGYLREVVFALADKADALAERAREQALRAGARPKKPAAIKEDPLAAELAFLRQMRDYGQIEPAEYEQRAAAARERRGDSA